MVSQSFEPSRRRVAKVLVQKLLRAEKQGLAPFGDCQQGEWRKNNGAVCRKVCVFDVSWAIGIARFESVSESQPNRTLQCH